MPLKSEPYYWVKCDSCGKRCDYGSFTAWRNEDLSKFGCDDCPSVELLDLEIIIQPDSKPFEDAMKLRSSMSDFNEALAKLNASVGATREQMEALRKSMEEQE